ncbi:hypothetical protein ACOMHN_015272 [Nucella lapillus]
MDSKPQREHAGVSVSSVEEIKAALGDPHVLEIISRAVAAQILEPPRKEICGLQSTIRDLHAAIDVKEEQIIKLKDRVDELEQYGRRNSVRITSVPETKGESTDDIVKQICKQIDVDVTDEMIDRSHRVGKPPTAGETKSRPILVKFTSYRCKSKVMGARKKLSGIDQQQIVP